MRKFTVAFLRNPNPSLHSHAFLKRGPPPPPPSLSFNSLASPPPHAAEVGRKANVRKARELKADKLGCGSLHAEIPTSIAEENAKARPTRAKAQRKAKAKATELSHIGFFKAEDVVAHEEAQNAATGKAEEAALHAKFVFEEEKALQNAAIEEVAFNAAANESSINAKKELSEWAAKLNLNTFNRGRQWEEAAYKLLDHGISSERVKIMLPKCRTLPNPTNSVDSTLKHFTMLGMSHEEMGRAISTWPGILCISNNAFQSKVDFFESVGIGRCTLGKIMHKTYLAIAVSSSTLRDRCNFWKDYFEDVQENAFLSLILRNPRVLAWNVQKTVKPNIEYLEEMGFTKKMLFKHSSILGFRLKTIAMKFKLLEQFGIPNAKALAVLHSVSPLKLHARLHNLLALGFSFAQVQKIMVNFPNLLTFSEDNINLRLSYAVDVMNLSFDMLVTCPTFWGYSLEKRIKYRYGVLQELKTLGAYEKNIRLSYMLNMSDTAFSRRFVNRLEAYTKHSNI